MPFVPATNVCSVELVYGYEGQIMENVYHVQFPATPTTTSQASVAAAFVSWFGSYLRGVTANPCFLLKILVTDLTTVTSGGIEYVTGLPIPGTNGEDMSPGNVTVAVKWLTGIRGRSFRGRTYHVGLNRSMYTASTLFDASRAALVSAYGELLTIIGGLTGGYSLVVLSRRAAKAPRITAVASIITSVAVDPTLDSQRRRLPGRGR